jgi:hypothetical protein
MQKIKLMLSSTELSNFFRSKKLFSILVAATLLLGVGPNNSAHATTNYASKVSAQPTASSLLAKLAIKGRAPKTGYSRSLFSDGWGTIGSCDTRNFILSRDLTNIVWRSGETCIVASGVLREPYSGKIIYFVRGVKTSLAVQIDHVVPVSDAWQKGAQQWSSSKRYNFYNDPLNLLAVDGPLNGAKSDSDAASWLPPNKSYRCAYVARQIAVKAKYAVWVTSAERVAMANVLTRCPGFKVPRG